MDRSPSARPASGAEVTREVGGMICNAAFGLLNPAFAGAAMGLSSVSVVTNSLRLLRFGRHGRYAAGAPDLGDVEVSGAPVLAEERT